MRNYYLFILFISLFLVPDLTEGQGREHLWIDGKVINQADSVAIPLTQIASYKLVQIYAADTLGEFFISVPKGDSLKFLALGFEPLSVLADDLVGSLGGKHYIALKRTSYMIEQVDINYYKKFSEYQDYLKKMRAKQAELDLLLPPDIKLGKGSDIPPDLRPLYRKRPPVLAAFFQPINYIYYHTSKLEKSKVKMLKIMQESIIREQLSVELMQNISDYEGKELENFIVYCNVNIKLNKYDTKETIAVKVMDLLTQYKQQ